MQVLFLCQNLGKEGGYIMFEELKRKEELKEIKMLISEILAKTHDIDTKLDGLNKSLRKGELAPRTAVKQQKDGIS